MACDASHPGGICGPRMTFARSTSTSHLRAADAAHVGAPACRPSCSSRCRNGDDRSAYRQAPRATFRSLRGCRRGHAAHSVSPIRDGCRPSLPHIEKSWAQLGRRTKVYLALNRPAGSGRATVSTRLMVGAVGIEPTTFWPAPAVKVPQCFLRGRGRPGDLLRNYLTISTFAQRIYNQRRGCPYLPDLLEQQLWG